MNKERLFSFMLGVIATVSIAATSTDFMTVRPAKPLSTIVYSCAGPGCYSEDAEAYIKANIKLGYQVKCVVSGNSNSWLIVMEKY